MQVNKTDELTNVCFLLAVLERAWGKKRECWQVGYKERRARIKSWRVMSLRREKDGYFQKKLGEPSVKPSFSSPQQMQYVFLL